MPGITQFEVQVQQGKRWSIHAQFGSFQKEAAVEEAKGLESMPSISAVKVVREVYDPDRGTSQEFGIYKSDGVTALAQHETDATDGAKATSWMDDDSATDSGDDGIDDFGYYDEDEPKPKK